MICTKCGAVVRAEYKISAVEKKHLDLCLDCSEELIEKLQAKTKWQTGKPPRDGWYWVRHMRFDDGRWMRPKIERVGTHYASDVDTQWSGPIPEPEE